jgi:GNAT superfamily N-acetyltransferase
VARSAIPYSASRLLRGSSHIVLAVASDDRVVGFITAASDGVLSAYIPLLEVLPAWRGRGIGGELVRRMLARLANLYMIDVVCDPDVVPFYQVHGFSQGTAMMLRRYDRQAARSVEEGRG